MFLFTYDVLRNWSNIDANYLDHKYNIDKFKKVLKIAVEFQILSKNFRTCKKIEIIKVYSFCLLRIYPIQNPVQALTFTPKKQQQGKDN